MILPAVVCSYEYFHLVEHISDSDLYPSSLEIFNQVIFIAIVFETLFYWSHRLFHTP